MTTSRPRGSGLQNQSLRVSGRSLDYVSATGMMTTRSDGSDGRPVEIPSYQEHRIRTVCFAGYDAMCSRSHLQLQKKTSQSLSRRRLFFCFKRTDDRGEDRTTIPPGCHQPPGRLRRDANDVIDRPYDVFIRCPGLPSRTIALLLPPPLIPPQHPSLGDCNTNTRMTRARACNFLAKGRLRTRALGAALTGFDSVNSSNRVGTRPPLVSCLAGRVGERGEGRGERGSHHLSRQRESVGYAIRRPP
jgi:hypothetical protein